MPKSSLKSIKEHQREATSEKNAFSVTSKVKFRNKPSSMSMSLKNLNRHSLPLFPDIPGFNAAQATYRPRKGSASNLEDTITKISSGYTDFSCSKKLNDEEKISRSVSLMDLSMSTPVGTRPELRTNSFSSQRLGFGDGEGRRSQDITLPNAVIDPDSINNNHYSKTDKLKKNDKSEKWSKSPSFYRKSKLTRSRSGAVRNKSVCLSPIGC